MKFTKENKTQHKGKTLAEFLAPSAVSVFSSHIQMGGLLARTLFVSTYPRYVRTSWFSPIINMDRQFDVSIFIHPLNTVEILKKLRSQLGKVEAQIMEEQSAGKVRNPKLETAAGDIEQLRDQLQQGNEKFFEFGIYITFYAKTEAELGEIENTIKGVLDAQLVYTKRATFRMDEGFMSTLPLGNDKLQIHTSANTEPISSLFPFVSYDLTTNTGLLYGINLHNNSLVLYDRFDLENANAVIFGKSGGGKSYAVKLEILRNMVFGTQVFVIDPENEYSFLSSSIGGSSINISLASSDHINPFDVPMPAPGETFEEVLRSHIANLVGFFKLALGGLSPEEEATVDEGIRQTYASKDITGTSSPESVDPPTLSDFQEILGGMTGTESVVLRLKKYSEGSFAGFLNNRTNVSLDNYVVVFSIRDMEPELRPIAMYLVLNYIWTRVRKELRKRLLVVDEAWWLLKTDFGGQFLLSIAKRARKYYLGLTTISQDIPDFLQSEYGGPILTNSSLQMLLRQSPASIEIVQQTFNLTDSEKYFLLNTQVGHGLFFAGQNHVAIRVIASYAEDQIITSDPKQLLEIQEAKRQIQQGGSQKIKSQPDVPGIPGMPNAPSQEQGQAQESDLPGQQQEQTYDFSANDLL